LPTLFEKRQKYYGDTHGKEKTRSTDLRKMKRKGKDDYFNKIDMLEMMI